MQKARAVVRFLAARRNMPQRAAKPENVRKSSYAFFRDAPARGSDPRYVTRTTYDGCVQKPDAAIWDDLLRCAAEWAKWLHPQHLENAAAVEGLANRQWLLSNCRKI